MMTCGDQTTSIRADDMIKAGQARANIPHAATEVEVEAVTVDLPLADLRDDTIRAAETDEIPAPQMIALARHDVPDGVAEARIRQRTAGQATGLVK
jgi:hypothetical protein